MLSEIETNFYDTNVQAQVLNKKKKSLITKEQAKMQIEAGSNKRNHETVTRINRLRGFAYDRKVARETMFCLTL